MRYPKRTCSQLFVLALVALALTGCFSGHTPRLTAPSPASAPFSDLSSDRSSSAPSHDDRVKTILDAQGVKYEITSRGNFKMTWKRKNGRTHVILVNSKTWDLKPLEIREVFAIAYRTRGDFSRDVAFGLLQDSDRRKLGAWEIHRNEDQNSAAFVVKISADANAQQLMNAISLVLEVADDIEKELTDGRDDF